MASRLLAKKYLRGVIDAPGLPATERECLEVLIASHKTLREAEQLRWDKLRSRSWFGRLLWKMLGRWL